MEAAFHSKILANSRSSDQTLSNGRSAVNLHIFLSPLFHSYLHEERERENHLFTFLLAFLPE